MELRASTTRREAHTLTTAPMRLVKFLLWSAFVVCVGLPCAFVLFVMGMAAFGIVFGLGMAIVGMLLAVVKVALMVIVPAAIIYWLLTRNSSRSRVY